MVNMRMFALLVGASGTLSYQLPEFCRACAAVVVQPLRWVSASSHNSRPNAYGFAACCCECVRVSHVGIGHLVLHRAVACADRITPGCHCAVQI